jgi:hypothetical protein
MTIYKGVEIDLFGKLGITICDTIIEIGGICHE